MASYGLGQYQQIRFTITTHQIASDIRRRSNAFRYLNHVFLLISCWFFSGWNGVITDVTENEEIRTKLAQNNQQLQSALKIKENFLVEVTRIKITKWLNSDSTMFLMKFELHWTGLVVSTWHSFCGLFDTLCLGLLTILSDSHLTQEQREWTSTALDCCDSLLHVNGFDICYAHAIDHRQ
jgi:hypothetical protein